MAQSGKRDSLSSEQSDIETAAADVVARWESMPDLLPDVPGLHALSQAIIRLRDTLSESSPSDSRVHLVRLGPPGHGDVIHRSDCTYARRHSNALRWIWADRQGFDNIDWDALRRHGIKPCGHCRAETLR